MPNDRSGPPTLPASLPALLERISGPLTAIQLEAELLRAADPDLDARAVCAALDRLLEQCERALQLLSEYAPGPHA